MPERAGRLRKTTLIESEAAGKCDSLQPFAMARSSVSSALLHAVAASFETGGERAAVIDLLAAGCRGVVACRIVAALAYRPLMALIAIRRLLLFGLTVLRIVERLTARRCRG